MLIWVVAMLNVASLVLPRLPIVAQERVELIFPQQVSFDDSLVSHPPQLPQGRLRLGLHKAQRLVPTCKRKALAKEPCKITAR